MRTRAPARSGSGGFTLIELLVVILVLGVLAGIVIFAVGSTREDATAAACAADRKTLRTAITAYEAKTGNPPASLTDLTAADQHLRNNGAISGNSYIGDGYTLTYGSGSLSDCAAAIAAGGGGPSPPSTPSGPTVAPATLAAPTNGFQTVTINGTGFVSGAVVTISGGVNAKNSALVNATTMTIEVNAPVNKRGTYTVTVTNPNGSSGSNTLEIT